MPVNTAQADHRQLRFRNIDECLAEIDRIVAADKAGKLRRTGNWSAGQNFNHIATWINYGYEGYPLKTPWFIRMILKRKVAKYIRDGMRQNVRIPGVKGGTYGTDDMPIDQAADKLRKSLKRLASEPAVYESPAFGSMTEEQRVAMMLRHAELHLGFLHY